jgi:hypothetical protein
MLYVLYLMRSHAYTVLEYYLRGADTIISYTEYVARVVQVHEYSSTVVDSTYSTVMRVILHHGTRTYLYVQVRGDALSQDVCTSTMYVFSCCTCIFFMTMCEID